MTTNIKANGVEDFLPMVPALLGYQPQHSIVSIPFANGRTIGAIRFDLPDITDADPVMHTVVGYVCRTEADSVAFVLYVDRRAQALPFLTLAPTIAEQAGLGVVVAAYVTPDGWGTLSDEHDTPLSGLPEAAAAVAGPLVSLQEQAALPILNEDERKAIDPFFDEAEDVFSRDDVVPLADKLGVGDVEPKTIGHLAGCLQRPSIRDSIIVHLVSGRGEDAIDAQLAWEDGLPYPTDLAMTLWGEGPRPDPKKLARAVAVVARVAAYSNDAGAYATLAWLNWALGKSTVAEIQAKRGLSVDPNHGLCEIVASFINAGHLPNWAFAR